jgi:L-lactate dehydrogenase complex protein LldG
VEKDAGEQAVKDDRQTAFIGRIRTALGNPSPERAALAPRYSERHGTVLDQIKSRSGEDYQRLLDGLAETARPINLKLTAVRDTAAAAAVITALIDQKRPEWGTEKRVAAWDHPLIKSLGLPELLAGRDVPVFFTQPLDGTGDRAYGDEIRRNVEEAYVGVTSADFCVVESATLVMKTRPGHARSVSLIPSIHVAVIYISQLLANLSELYAVLSQDPDHRAEGLTNCLTFISGPSKTADIEAMLVHGAHGPREMELCVITG